MGKRDGLFSALVVALSLVSCIQEKIVLPGERTVLVQVDLQQGFGGQNVVIAFNQVEHFRGALAEGEPLAGPNASLAIQLPRETNRLEVTWWQSAAQHPAPVHQQSLDLVLGEAEHYYVGLSVLSATLEVRIQERPFLYGKLIGFAGPPNHALQADWNRARLLGSLSMSSPPCLSSRCLRGSSGSPRALGVLPG